MRDMDFHRDVAVIRALLEYYADYSVPKFRDNIQVVPKRGKMLFFF